MSKTVERDYYTVAEAAEKLHVSHSTVWRWIRAGKLPAYRVGSRNLRIKQSDLNNVVEATQGEVNWDSMSREERREYLLRPLTDEEQAQQRELFAQVMENRKRRSIAPMTSDELVRLSRDKDSWYGADD
mgnify:CR=1 FL=1